MTDHDMIFLLLSLVIILIAAQAWTQKRLASFTRWIAAATELFTKHANVITDLVTQLEAQKKKCEEERQEITEQITNIWDNIK